MNRSAPAGRRGARRRVGIALALAATLVAGCSVGPDFVRPPPPAVDRYTAHRLSIEGAAPADGSAQHLLPGERLAGDWWQLFRSDALDAVVRRALAGNRTLEAAASTLARMAFKYRRAMASIKDADEAFEKLRDISRNPRG